MTRPSQKWLSQVTSAMKQNGENHVGLIKSQTANKVSQKMAEAASVRPEVVGSTLNSIAKNDPEVLEAVLTVMETEKLLESGASVEVIPEGTSVLVQLGSEGGGHGDRQRD